MVQVIIFQLPGSKDKAEARPEDGHTARVPVSAHLPRLVSQEGPGALRSPTLILELSFP